MNLPHPQEKEVPFPIYLFLFPQRTGIGGDRRPEIERQSGIKPDVLHVAVERSGCQQEVDSGKVGSYCFGADEKHSYYAQQEKAEKEGKLLSPLLT